MGDPEQAGQPQHQQGGGCGKEKQEQQSRSELSPLLQQLNLESIRTRTHNLYNAIARILHSFHSLPHHKWSEVLGQFSMVNVDLLNLVEDIKPILKMFVVHPKTVNAENANVLPVMFSSKFLPEMEAEETCFKEQALLGLANLPVQLQTEKLQRQIEMVRAACDNAEKVLAENRKLYGLGPRQVPAVTTTLDKAQAAKITEQEKLLRAAVNAGEGLRLNPNEHQQPLSLPPHLQHALSSAGASSLAYQGMGFPKSPALSTAVGTLPGASQQAAAAQLLGRSPLQMLAASSIDGNSASPMSYVHSPRSGNAILNEASPQQQQQQHQQQQQQTLLQRQKLQQQLQLQKQQQHLRPGTPPIQLQSQLQQLHHTQLQQIQQAQHDRHQLQQLQLQQLQNNPLQQGQQLQQSLNQNQLTQASQAKQHLGHLSSNPNSSLFGNAQSPMLSSNMMANISQAVQPQPLLQQRVNYGMGMQSQRNLASQMLSDPMYNSGIQTSGNLGLPVQQQLVGQSNFNNILNPTQGFGQQRQLPPSQ